MKVQDKVVVITGGANGIGRELVLVLLASGARVAAVDIDESALRETVGLAREIKDSLSTHVLDITELGAVSTLPDKVIAHHGAVDALINNAGIIQPFLRANELDYAHIERLMAVNFYGTLYMTKEFLPRLLERPVAHIVNVSSMGGFLPVPGQSLYGASKAAVKLFTEGLHSELADTNVRVTVVFPGAVGTNIAENSGVSIELGSEHVGSRRSFEPMDATKAARMIVNGIEKDRYRILVGSDAKFMDLIYRLSPKYAANYIYKQMKSLLPN